MQDTVSRERRWRRLGPGGAVTPLVVAALLPKCPLCFTAWLGIGAVGLWLKPVWGLPLTTVLVCASLTVIALGWRERRKESRAKSGAAPGCHGSP